MNNRIGISSSNKFKRLFISLLLKYAHLPHCWVHAVLKEVISLHDRNGVGHIGYELMKMKQIQSDTMSFSIVLFNNKEEKVIIEYSIHKY